MNLKRIGTIHSPFRDPDGMPINVRDARNVKGTVVVARRYAVGLNDLSGFGRIWLVFWFHRARPARLIVTPYMDTKLRGLFSTRAPSRPNPIGISCVSLLKVEDNVLHVAGLDILDGTPLLDIKPYQPSDRFTNVRFGWMDRVWRNRPRADGRFARG
jgi:tRNA (adenine37-N6)-methyltransferase